MFRKKIETFSVDYDWNKRRILLRDTSCTSHAVSEFEVVNFFGRIVVFCQCGLESLEMLENCVTLERWIILPVKSH